MSEKKTVQISELSQLEINYKEDIKELIRAYFEQYGLVSHHIRSYEHFIEHTIQEIIDSTPDIVIKSGHRTLIVQMGRVYISKPTFVESDETMSVITPHEAGIRNLTYSINLYVDITKTIEEENDGQTHIEENKELVFIGSLPVMVNSKFCTLHDIPRHLRLAYNECPYDEGGYFIISGSEKVLVSQERIVFNEFLVFNKDQGYTVEIRSVSENRTITVFTINENKGSILAEVMYLKAQVPIIVLLRALGLSDLDYIYNIIAPNSESEILEYLDTAVEEASEIPDYNSALTFIAEKINNRSGRNLQSKAVELLRRYLLPHLGISEYTELRKAYYICLMVQALLRVKVGLKKEDDRDHLKNKRLESSGLLLNNRFRKVYKDSFINEFTQSLKKAVEQNKDLSDITVYIDNKKITNGVKLPFSTGNWGEVGAPKTGVSQVLSRMNYVSTLSHINRVTTQTDKQSKLQKPRYLHGTQFGKYCVTGDTMIVCMDNRNPEDLTREPILKPIKDLVEGTDIILTVNPKTLQEEYSGFYNKFSLMPKKLLKITTVGGRSIRCTGDHPFLVHTGFKNKSNLPWENKIQNGINKWIVAENLKIGHQLIVQHSYKKCIDCGNAKDSTCEKYTPSKIIKIEEIPPELVYDFTTYSDNHSFVGNGFIQHQCSSETPEGGTIGLVKNLAFMTTISTETPSEPFLIIFEHLGVIPLELATMNELARLAKVLVNGAWLGVYDDPHELTKQLRSIRRSGHIPFTTSISYLAEENMIRVITDEGRIMRPLLVVENGQTLINSQHIHDLISGRWKWSDFVDNGFIDFLDAMEEEDSLIAITPDILAQGEKSGLKYTHLELHPSLMLGHSASTVPFPDHNEGSRVLFQAAMGKQAIGIPMLNHNVRMDTMNHVLDYPQKPIASTQNSEICHINDLPMGMNAMLAIMIHSGFNQEDSLIINQSAVDRGFGRSTFYKTYLEQEKTLESTIRIEKPNKMIQKNIANYSKLDEDGLISPGTVMEKGDVLVGKTKQISGSPKTDNSFVLKEGEGGVVDRVVLTTNPNGLKMVKIKMRTLRVPEIGDKFCLTPDHEVLTTDGWVPIDKVTIEHEVACLEPSTSKLEYHKPTQLYEFDHNDKMYHIKNQQIDLCTTFNHKMYVKLRDTNEFDLIEANKIIGKRVQYKKDAVNNNPSYQIVLPACYRYEEAKPNMRYWLELFGWWIAEGWVSENNRKKISRGPDYSIVEYRVEMCQVKHQGRERIKELANLLGYHIYSDKKETKLYISNIQLAKFLLPYSVGAPNKYLPDWVWQLSAEQCRYLIDGIIGGDGHTYISGSVGYFTNSTRLKDDFQRLCLHAGWSGNAVLLSQAGRLGGSINGRQIVSKYNAWKIGVNKNKNTPEVNHSHNDLQIEEEIEYNGKVYCLEVPTHIFYVRRNGLPVWTGNSARHGQKGTIGMVYRQEDLPFTKDGLVPDLIMNPHAVPSRMTIGQILEAVTQKIGAAKGTFRDATPFNEFSVNKLMEELEKLGFEKTGLETMYSGRTGEKMEAMIFMCPVYYQRLKHLVAAKIHARARGPLQMLTRQPLEGRSRDGGLRFGEMEKDVMVSHGSAAFLKDRLFDNSDPFQVPVCRNCGMIAVGNAQQGLFRCGKCRNTEVYMIDIPYAGKLLFQELMSMNIAIRMQY